MSSFSENTAVNTPIPQEEHSCEDCAICLELLQMYLDGEASKKQCEFVKMHIDNYKRCMECYEFANTMRDALKNKMSKKIAPEDLLSHVQSICK